MPQTVGIVIPAYKPNIEQTRAYLKELALLDTIDTIRLEIDAPSENTLQQLTDFPISVGISPNRRGKGAAITSGFESLDTDILVFADADGSTPPEDIRKTIKPLLNGQGEISVGSRRHPDATILSHQTIVRRFLGKAFAQLSRALLTPDLYDYQCGAKALTRESWETIRNYIYEPGFAWDIELLEIGSVFGFRIFEVPISWADTTESTVSPILTPLKMFTVLISVRIRANQLKKSPLPSIVTGNPERPRTFPGQEVNDD